MAKTKPKPGAERAGKVKAGKVKAGRLKAGRLKAGRPKAGQPRPPSRQYTRDARGRFSRVPGGWGERHRRRQAKGLNAAAARVSKVQEGLFATHLQAAPPSAQAPHPKWVRAAVRWAEKHGAKVEVAGQHEFPPGAAASYNWRTDVIKINKDHSGWKDPAAAATKAYERGWLSSDHPAHYITHELGHRAHRDAVGYDKLPRAEQARVLDGFRQPVHEQLRAKIESTVSKYAASSKVEFVAESYAALKAGRKLDPVLLRYYKHLGGVDP